MKRAVVCCVSLLAMAIAAIAQQLPSVSTKHPSNSKPEQPDPWLERAKELTNQILTDRANLPKFEYELLPARLGQEWWTFDQLRARYWIELSFPYAERVPQNEKAEDRVQRVLYAGALLRAVMQTAPEFRKRAEGFVYDITNSDVSRGGARNRGNLELQQAGLELLHNANDPVAAADVAEQLIKLHYGFAIQSLLPNIGEKDSAQGERLLQAAIAEAQRTGDADLLFNLTELAFPSFAGSNFALTEDQKAEIAAVVTQAFVAPAATQDDLAVRCKLSLQAARVQSAAAAQATLIAERLQECKALTSPHTQADIEASQKPQSTVDDALESAETEPDLRARVNLKIQAKELARQAHDYVRALEILRGFSPEERDAYDWANDYRNLAVQVVQPLLKSRDLQAVQRLVDDAPNEVKADLLTIAANALDRAGQKAYAASMLSQARTELVQHPVANPNSYSSVFAAVLRLSPQDANIALRQYVEGLNNIPKPEKKPGHIMYNEPGEALTPMYFLGPLIDLDPNMVRADADELQSPRARESFRLTLLHAALAKYEAEKKQRLEAVAKTATKRSSEPPEKSATSADKSAEPGVPK